MESRAPSCILATTHHCPHCQSVLASLTELEKQGDIASLEVVKIDEDATRLDAYNIRSVPWIKIDQLELNGLYSLAELKKWVSLAESGNSYEAYIFEKIELGELHQAADFIAKQSISATALPAILADSEVSLQHRLGLGAIMEILADTSYFSHLHTGLLNLLKHEDHRMICDALYYLGLNPPEGFIKKIEPFLNHPNPEVSEIANDIREELSG